MKAVFEGKGNYVKREVWISHERWISITEEDGSGGYLPATELTCDFAQNVTHAANYERIEDRQPGKATPDFDRQPAGYTIRIGNFYSKKADDFSPFDVNGKKFRIQIAYINPRYSGIAPEENDYHVFRDCVCLVNEVSSADDQLATSQLEFVGERME